MTEARSSLTVDGGYQANPHVTVVAVSGELDLATIDVLKGAVAAQIAPRRHVVLDLAELTFCDSTGLGAFVALHREARAAGAMLALAGPRKRIADLFTLSGIDQVLAVYGSVADATAASGESAA